MALLRLIDADNIEDNEKKDYKRKPIKFYINTNGGALADMYAISDIITNSKTPIYTYCTGKAWSAGAYLLMCGHKRFVSPHASVMIHTLASGTRGKIQEMVEDVQQSVREQVLLEKYVLSHTKITQDKLDDIRERKFDWFLTPQDCIDLGVADDWIVNEPQEDDK